MTASRSGTPPSTTAPYRQLRLCSGGGGFEAVPDRPLRVDLARVRDRLAAEGIRVLDARTILIVGLEVEVTISRAGRVLFKTRDPATAERLLPRILEAIAPNAR